MIIDAHVHCGIQDKFPPQSYDDYFSVISGSGIKEAVMFPPVMEIYDRYDQDFADSTQWKNGRKAANEYLLHIGTTDLTVIPYFFIWNDFAVNQLTSQHKGIKWHRHSDDPCIIMTVRDADRPLMRSEAGICRWCWRKNLITPFDL